MDYSFNIEIACKYGVESAVLINNLYWWITKNMANNKHFYDERYWTYNSQGAFLKLFPFWTKMQLRRVIDKLKDDGTIIVGNYNKTPMDRTQWYTLSNDVLKIYAKDGAFDFSGCTTGEEIKDGAESDLPEKEEKLPAVTKGEKAEKVAETPVIIDVFKSTHAYVQTNTCICSNQHMHMLKPTNVPNINTNTKQIIKPINQSKSNNLEKFKLYNTPISPKVIDGRMDNIPKISEKAKWYIEWFSDKLDELSGNMSILAITSKFLALIEDMSHHKEIAINGYPVTIEKIYEHLISLFCCTDYYALVNAYEFIESKAASGLIKNKFNYTVSTLYNASRQ